ncbi:MAG: class I SAM-dependent methyltransferase [Eubacteriales bacterium]|nr:class I SAM-dependent methyltransferase [Eubacteriales bacterium]
MILNYDDQRDDSKPKYENIVTKRVIDVAIFVFFLGICILFSNIHFAKHVYVSDYMIRVMGVIFMVGGVYMWISTEILNRAFDHEGKKQLIRGMAEAVVSRLDVPEDSIVLDVGCKDAFLTILLAKKHPDSTFYGVDHWDFGTSSRKQCIKNCDLEGVNNVKIESGDAYDLPYAHDTFDGIASLFFYHNYTAVDMKNLYMESMRVLKEGCPFVICDLVTPSRYGNPEEFRQKMLAEGIKKFDYISLSEAGVLSPFETAFLRLRNCKIVVGIK